MRKKRELAVLRGEMEQIRSDPYVKLAEQLHQGVHARISESGSDLDTLLDQELAEMKQAIIRDALAAKLASIGTEELLAVAATHLGDIEADQMLRERAEVVKSFSRSNQHIEAMQIEAQQRGKVDLGRLAVDDVVTLGLFGDHIRPEDRCVSSSRSHDQVKLRRIENDISQGVLFQVLGLVELDAEDYYFELSDHRIVQVGGAPNLEGDGLDPVIWRDSGVSFIKHGKSRTHTTEDVLGYVLVNDIPVLDY